MEPTYLPKLMNKSVVIDAGEKKKERGNDLVSRIEDALNSK